jgi:hypothetical protein
MLQLGPARVVSTLSSRERAAYKAHYRRHAYIHLPNFLEPAFLASVQANAKPKHFVQKVASHTNCRNVLKDLRWSVLMGVLLGQKYLFDFVEEISDCPEPITDLRGSICSLKSKGDHYVGWHQDPPCLPGRWADATLIVNIGGAYEGGETEIRGEGTDKLIARVSIPKAGDAFIFRNGLTHRSAPVTGRRPKVTYISWFSLIPRVVPREIARKTPAVLAQLSAVAG